MNKARLKRKSLTLGEIINIMILLIFAFICIYPFWYILIGSISNPNYPVRTLTLLPKDVTLYNYKEVLKMEGLLSALWMSVARTSLGMVCSVLFTSLMAYLFTLQRMPARKFFYRMVVITMYLSAGLVPTFLVYKGYGLLNSFWVYIIPVMLSAYNMILVKTFMESGVPGTLRESAELDGAGVLTIYGYIMMPLSRPILASISLFEAVRQWNSWFDNKIYNIGTNKYDTLQFLLHEKLNEATVLARILDSDMGSESMSDLLDMMKLTPDSIRMTLTMIVTIPIFCVYPFVQKHFVKGIMIGSVKG